MDQLQIMFLLVLFFVQATIALNRTCASCEYVVDEKNKQKYKGQYDALKKFVTDRGFQFNDEEEDGREPYFTKECARSIYPPHLKASLIGQIEYYMYKMLTVQCIGDDYKCGKLTYEDAGKEVVFFRGCFKNCGEEVNILGEGEKYQLSKVHCCTDFDYCNSAANYEMNMIHLVMVFSGVWWFLRNE